MADHLFDGWVTVDQHGVRLEKLSWWSTGALR
jgi:hypothetical protein